MVTTPFIGGVGGGGSSGDFFTDLQRLITQASSPGTGGLPGGAFGSGGTNPARSAEFLRAQRRRGAASDVLNNPGFFQALSGVSGGPAQNQAQGPSQVDQLISGLTQTGRTQIGGIPASAGGGAPTISTTPGGASKSSGGGARGSTSISGSAISLLTSVDDDKKKIQTLLGG